MLNSFQVILYQRLQDFELDDPTHEFGFTRHLMKNQGWTLTYAQRAIVEYKKFAFLTVVANHQVVPSDQVDQVWHAHVLLTQSYWEEFCPKVLGKKLYHHPARGGRMERAEFHDLYAQTIASYRHFFGSPPTDIWSPPDRRFGAELKMQRVNLSEHWVIPKRFPQQRLTQPLGTMAIITLMTLGYVEAVQGSPIERFVADITANPLPLFTVCVILGVMLRYTIRIPDKQPQKPELDIYQMAYLAGGSQRAVELAITQLVHQEYLRVNVRNRTFAIKKTLPSGANRLEKEVMRQVHRTPDLNRLRQTSKYQTHFLQERLEQEKLLMTGWAVVIGISFLFFFVITSLLGIFFNVLCSSLGIKIAEISIIINVLWPAIGIITICCFVPSRRTCWGSRILADLQKTHDVYDVAQRFAIYGYRVLSGGALDDLKQVFKAENEAEAGGCGCGC